LETVKIQYERLFNLGNFDHEKFSISKDVEASTETKALVKTALLLADLELELNAYRKLEREIESLSHRLEWGGLSDEDEDRETMRQQLNRMMAKAKAFREKHKPLHKACKCPYCTGEYDE
jgi:hypothetical protein